MPSGRLLLGGSPTLDSRSSYPVGAGPPSQRAWPGNTRRGRGCAKLTRPISSWASRGTCACCPGTDAESARVIGVWHDPLQRFAHLVRLFQAKPTRYHWFMGLGYDSPPEAYLELARWELDKPRLADQEEGFRRQCDMFAAVGVEQVITLPELVPLLRAHGVRWRRFARPGALRACEPLPPGVIEQVRELYAADLTIPARSRSGA